MQPLNATVKASLQEATEKYHAAVGQVAGFLEMERGISRATVDKFRLGLVADPSTEDEKVKGWLAIPSIGPDGDVRSIRFRCLEDHDHQELGHGKYMGRAGVTTGLFNVRAVTEAGDEIHVTEGEIDAISLEQCGLSAIGVTGANGWKPHYNRLLAGFSRVYVWQDNDEAGKRFVKEVVDGLANASVVRIGVSGCKDINDVLTQHGSRKVIEQIGARR